MKFAFIRDALSGPYPVDLACDVLEVSRSGWFMSGMAPRLRNSSQLGSIRTTLGSRGTFWRRRVSSSFASPSPQPRTKSTATVSPIPFTLR